MEDRKITFGEFLRAKRKEKRISIRPFAELAGLSPIYISYMETNQRAAPRDDDTLMKMAGLLSLTKGDEQKFLDLAAESAYAPRVSGDLPKYIMGNDFARTALRVAKDVNATDKEWQEFKEKLQRRAEEAKRAEEMHPKK